MENETILEIGAEGGSIKVYKTQENQYFFSTSEFDLEDNFSATTSNVENSFKKILIKIRNKYPIYSLHPQFVHQGYIDIILEDLSTVKDFIYFDYHQWAIVLQLPKSYYKDESDWQYAVGEMEKSLRKNFKQKETKSIIQEKQLLKTSGDMKSEENEFNIEGFKEEETVEFIKTIADEKLVGLWKVSLKDNAHKPKYISWLETEIRSRNIIEQFNLQKWIK